MARVIVVGSINVDLVVRVPTLPGPGETTIGGSFVKSYGGKGANQAAAAARLGAEAWLVGLTGDDGFGQEARRDLEAFGVRIDRVGTVAASTGVAAILVDDGGENLIAVASGANERVTATFVEDALGGLLAPGTVILADLEVPLEAVGAAAGAARAAGCRFLLNPAPAQVLPEEVLRASDVLIPNEHEALGLGAATVEDLLVAGAGAVIVTRAGRGADLHRAGRPVRHQAAFPAEVVDTTGAGDAFCAAVAWAIAADRDLEEAVRLAAAAGAIATEAAGARGSLPTAANVESRARAGAQGHGHGPTSPASSSSATSGSSAPHV